MLLSIIIQKIHPQQQTGQEHTIFLFKTFTITPQIHMINTPISFAHKLPTIATNFLTQSIAYQSLDLSTIQMFLF